MKGAPQKEKGYGSLSQGLAWWAGEGRGWRGWSGRGLGGGRGGGRMAREAFQMKENSVKEGVWLLRGMETGLEGLEGTISWRGSWKPDHSGSLGPRLRFHSYLKISRKPLSSLKWRRTVMLSG